MTRWTKDALIEINSRPWDGNPRIESPFVEGDYLLVAEAPRLSMQELKWLYEYPLIGATEQQDRQIERVLAQIFADWHLTGKDGKPIPKPGFEGGFLQLTQSVFGWVVGRALRVVITNPLP